MIYCDTSLLVTALTDEWRSERAQQWLAAQPSGALCISHWVITEFSSALAIKLRRNDMPVEERGRILAEWQAVQRDRLAILPVTAEAFALAARFCDRHETGLRSGDALHLAVTLLGGHSLATLDRAMAEAAIAVGVAVESL